MSKKKKHKNPENLYKRGDTWWIRYNASGKKIRRSLGTTSLREAKKLRDQILYKRSAAAKFGLEEPAKALPRRTFAQLADRWLESRHASGDYAPNTLKNNRLTMRGILIPRFGPMLLHTITVEDLESFISDLRDKYARMSVARVFANLRVFVRECILRGWYDGPNPLDRLQRTPTDGPGRDTTLTEDEAARLLGELDGRVYYMSALAMYTGLRWGEVHGLAWADLALDADPPTLTVRRSFNGPPKNQASSATVPVTADVATLMRRWQNENPPRTPWVFPNKHGNLHVSANSNERKAIHAATERAGIDKRITPHVFRHSFGTWVYERTGDPKIVQRLMRHATFLTSMKYVHDRRDLAPVVNTLPQLIAKPALRVI